MSNSLRAGDTTETPDTLVASLLRANAELQQRLDEALAQQIATAEVLQVINSSPGDLAPVFDAILEKARRLCDFHFGILYTYDGEAFRAVALHGAPPRFAEYMAGRAIVPQPGGRAGLSQLFAGKDVVYFEDVAREVAYLETAGARPLVDLAGAHTNVLVALHKERTLLGAVCAYRQEVRPFTEKQIALLQSFAAQAAIAMENARLITETREALEQQTATAEVLQVITDSRGELAPVFDAMLDKALGLCDAAFGVLWTYDGKLAHAAALRGVPPAYAEFLTRTPHPVGPENAPGRLLGGESVVHIADAVADQAYRSGDPTRRALVELGGGRTLLAVPLRKDNAFLGHFVIYRREVRPFSDKQTALLQNFAAQAVIAMENARLLTEQREALEQQTATAEVLQVINASPGNLVPVFEAILEKAHSLCGAVIGTLVVFDGESFRAVSTRGLPDSHALLLRQGFGINVYSRRLLDGERVVHIPDVRVVAVGDHEAARSLADNTNVRTSLWVPLRKDSKLLGFITAMRVEVRLFSDKEIALLENFAAQAVVAMENARLLDEIGQRQEELRVTFENMGDGVAMFDETPRLVAWNRKFQELLDVPDGVLAERLTYAEYIRYLTERGEFGLGVDTETQLRRLQQHMREHHAFERNRPDGRVIEVRRNPVPDGGFVLIYTDITERKRSEAEIRAARDAAEAAYRDLKAAQASLIQAEKMASLGQLTAGIAHEIKNPLNFVNNFAGLSVELLDELKEAAEPAMAALDGDRRAVIDETIAMLTGNLGKIAEHGKRADGIVKSMLEHSRGVSSERREVDLNNLVEEALNLAYHGARAQDQAFDITLERNYDQSLGRVQLVPQEMNRVIINLIGNGFYAASKRQRDGAEADFHPTLTVATRDLGDAVEVRVRDNGVGIAPEIRDKLFQPFFTTKPTGEGTGLGLSISYDIVTQQHGGTIDVDSRVGEFTEFAIRLPRTRLTTTAQTAEAETR